LADDDYGTGAKVRREVLGESEMDLAEARAGEVDAAFERYVTEAVWGTVWAGGGLDRRTRSLLVVALSARQGDDEDLLQHLRATRKTGATMAEIREAIMMVGVYAGIPAANRAMRLAKRVHGEEHGTSP
jgi:alkylhydroperoxidase/carboxymuconolactone decarboxylase family protein YurZ